MSRRNRKASRPAPTAATREPRRRDVRRFATVIASLIVVAAAFAAWRLSTAAPPRPNLLLITIDTLRADHVGAYGAAAAGVTPALDALAARGVRFDQAQTAVPLTGPSHATILTGLYPPSHGVRGNVVFTLGESTPTLATRLKRRGYRTAAFVGAYPVAAAFGFGQGFETFDEEFHESSPIDQGAERRGNEVADAALRWLDASGNRPFFAWLHFYDPHAPYDPPAPYRDRFAGRPYDGEIAFADAQIGRVLDALRAAGHDRDTVIVALADHGEGLGDHHELTHAVLTYQTTMRVPFIVAGPGVPRGKAVTTRVATIDVVPTALGLVGLPPDRTLLGRDLRPLMTGGAIASDPFYQESLFGRLNCHWATLRGWVQDDWKLITGAEPELYDLAADPGELRNLAAEQPDRARRMTEDLQRGLQRLAPGGDRAQPRAINAEQEERLRSLGYTGGSGGSGPLDDPSLPDPKTHVELYDRLQAAAAARGQDLARAFEDVQQITRVDPKNPFAFATLASMAYRHGSLTVAAQAFARALDLDPDLPGARQNYGKLLRELERYADSERELRLAVAQDESDTHARISLAETLIAVRKNAEAGQLVDAVLAKEPADPDALGAKGRLLMVEGRIKDALPYFEKATATPDPEPFIELARAYLAAGDTAKARETAADALRRSPGHPWAMGVLGTALIKDGQRDSGLEYLNRAAGVGPRRPIVWQSIAEGFDAAHEPARAAFCRKQAAALTGQP